MSDELEHEIAVLRPEAGDVLVLYAMLPADPSFRHVVRDLVDRFIAMVCRSGGLPLVVLWGGPGALAHWKPRVEQWDERTARVAYETLKKRFERG